MDHVKHAVESEYDQIGVESFEIDDNKCYGEVVSKPGKVTIHDNSKNRVVLSLLLLAVLGLALLLGVVAACVALGVEIAKLKSETASLDLRQQVGQNGMDVENINMLYQQLILNYSAIEARFDSLYKQTSQSYSAAELQLQMLYQQFMQNISATEDSFSQQLSEDHSEFHHQIQLLNRSTQLFSEQDRSEFHHQIQQLNLTTRLFSQQLSEDYSEIRNQVQQINVSTQLLVNDLISRARGLSVHNPADSCAALLPSSPSSYYWVRTSNGSAVRVYCDMTRSCGGVTGGWVRVAELDMTNSSHQCPSGLRQHTDSNIRTCVRSEDQAGCSSPENFIVNYNLQYSMICGQIIAYQYSSPDAFHNPNTNSIDSAYVDGVSLTYGHPRQHIWTFTAATDETEVHECPCLDGDLSTGDALPQFVGDDYFCDTASRVNDVVRFYSEDPLWDGAGCGSRSTCCSFNNPPWFYKQLPHPTTDGIEIRVCRNEAASNEDIAIEALDIYIQ